MEDEGNFFLKYIPGWFFRTGNSVIFHEGMKEIVSWLGFSHPFQRVGRYDYTGDDGWEGPALLNRRNKHRPVVGMLYRRVTITFVCSVWFSRSVVSNSLWPWSASLSITNSWSLPKPMSIESVMPSNHLILCHPLLLLPSILPSIRVFSSDSALRSRWPKYWSFSFNISPSNEHPGLISFRMDWLGLLVVQGTLRVFSNATVQKHQFFCA